MLIKIRPRIPILWPEALASANRDTFTAEWSTSIIFGSPEDMTDEDLCTIANELEQLWDAAHMDFRGIKVASGMTQRQLSVRLCTPLRTIEDWCTGNRAPSDPHRLLILKELSLI